MFRILFSSVDCMMNDEETSCEWSGRMGEEERRFERLLESKVM